MALSSSVPSLTTPVTGSKAAGFLSLKQRYTILQKVGYTGRPDERSMSAFEATLPGAKDLVAKLGKKAQEMKSLNAGGVVTSYAKGGEAIPRKTEIAGEPHMLAYINPEEEKMLNDAGSAGIPGPGGVPAYPITSMTGRDGTLLFDINDLSPTGPSRGLSADKISALMNKAKAEGGYDYTVKDGEFVNPMPDSAFIEYLDKTVKQTKPVIQDTFVPQEQKQVAVTPSTDPDPRNEFDLNEITAENSAATTNTTVGTAISNAANTATAATTDTTTADTGASNSEFITTGTNNDSAGGGASDGQTYIKPEIDDESTGYFLDTGSGNTMAEEVTISDKPEDIYGGTIATPVSTNLTEQADQVITNTPVTGDTVAEADIAKVGTSGKVDAATKVDASTYTAGTTAGKVKESLEGLEGLEGKVSEDAKVKAATGELSDEAKAEGVKFEKDKIDKVEAGTRKVGDEELAVAAGQDEEAVKTQIAQADTPAKIQAAQAEVKANEIAKAAQIKESDMASATAIASDGLSDDATAVAAKLAKFTVDEGTLAEFIEGSVNAQDTVQGQLSSLMKDFDDGTPVWAAGAIRAANAAMAARGLGTSSMAGAAIMQAAMESAIPIAAQDAQTFANMNLANLNNQQKVALTNAAAQQGVEIANFNAEQQTALQNSQNSFSLQSQDLSNFQAVIIANAQIKASLQGQNLSNRQQANLAEAARYAEVSNINLNNRQQSILQDSANLLQVDLANLSAKQQAYVSNAQLEAALQGKKIDNRQQTAINNSARFAEANNLTFNAAQQAQIHNSELMKTVGLAELNSEQAATLQNAAQIATMDLANLNNRQQAAVQNAKAFLEMDLANLSNDQQVLIFKAQAIQQSLLQDVAQENAAKQFNAASETQTNQFFADLKANIDKYNLGQMNDFKKFDVDQLNSTRQFNTSQNNSFKQFNQSNALVVAQANAAWRQSMATTNNATANEKAMFVAKEKNALTIAALDEIWQRKRDEIDYIFSAYESDQDRTQQIVLANMLENSEINAATFKAELEADATLISWGLDWLEGKLTSKD